MKSEEVTASRHNPDDRIMKLPHEKHGAAAQPGCVLHSGVWYFPTSETDKLLSLKPTVQHAVPARGHSQHNSGCVSTDHPSRVIDLSKHAGITRHQDCIPVRNRSWRPASGCGADTVRLEPTDLFSIESHNHHITPISVAALYDG